MFRKIVHFLFKTELAELTSTITQVKSISTKLEEQQKVFTNILAGIDVSVDAHDFKHEHSPSWAVISLQGKTSNYVKFVELGQTDITEIARFLRKFEKVACIKVDASPSTSQFLRAYQKDLLNVT